MQQSFSSWSASCKQSDTLDDRLLRTFERAGVCSSDSGQRREEVVEGGAGHGPARADSREFPLDCREDRLQTYDTVVESRQVRTFYFEARRETELGKGEEIGSAAAAKSAGRSSRLALDRRVDGLPSWKTDTGRRPLWY